MPEIPKLESYGFVNPTGPEIPTPSIAGSTALNQATAGFAEAVGKFSLNLIERRTRAQAADFVFDKKTKYAQALDDLSIELKAKYPDGSGYAEEFRDRADQIRTALGDGAENQLQTELWNKESGAMFASAAGIANSDGNILKTKAAIGRYDAVTQQSARRQLERPDFEAALRDVDSSRNYANEQKDLWGNPIEKEKMVKAGSSQIIESMVNGFAFQERYADGLDVLSRKEVADVLDADTLDKMRDMLNQKRKMRDGVSLSTLASRVEDYVKTAKSQTLDPASVKYGQSLRSELVTNSLLHPDKAFQYLNDMDNADSYGKRNLQLGATPTSQLPQFYEILMNDFQSNINRMAEKFPSSKVTGSLQIMNFSQREKWQNQFASLLQEDYNARMKDPNEYIRSNNQTLDNLCKQAFSPGAPQSVKDECVNQLTAQQKQLEVPMRMLTNEEALSVSAMLTQPANKATGVSGVGGVQALYGNYAGAAITDAISQDKNLPKEYALIGKMGNPQSQAALSDIVQNKKTINESFKGNSQLEPQEKTLEASISNLVAPVLGATANIRGTAQNLAFSEGLAEMTKLEAKRLMVSGVSQSQAVKQAWDTVFNKNFGIVNSGNSKVLYQAGVQQPKVIEAYVDAYSKPAALASLNIPVPQSYAADLRKRIGEQTAKLDVSFSSKNQAQQKEFINQSIASVTEDRIKKEWAKDLAKFSRFRTDRYGDGVELVLDAGEGVYPTGHSIKFKDLLKKNDPYVNAELRGFFGNIIKASY